MNEFNWKHFVICIIMAVGFFITHLSIEQLSERIDLIETKISAIETHLNITIKVKKEKNRSTIDIKKQRKDSPIWWEAFTKKEN